jgi:hypothetical protein
MEEDYLKIISFEKNRLLALAIHTGLTKSDTEQLMMYLKAELLIEGKATEHTKTSISEDLDKADILDLMDLLAESKDPEYEKNLATVLKLVPKPKKDPTEE